MAELTSDQVDATSDMLFEQGEALKRAGDHNGAMKMAIAAMRMVRLDIQHRTARRELGDQNKILEEASTTDALTGLTNRRGFLKTMDHEIAQAKRFGGPVVGMAYVDLDGFKAVNDTFGHEMGDNVLKEVANRLTSAFRETDTVCRTGGDEICIILPYENNDQFDPETIKTSVRKAMDGLYIWNEEDNQPYPIGASIGISSTLDRECDGLIDAQDIIEKMTEVADTRMYEDKWLNGEATPEDPRDIMHPKNARLAELRERAIQDYTTNHKGGLPFGDHDL